MATNITSNSDDVMTTSTTYDHARNGTEAAVPEGCLVIPFSVASPWNHPEDLVSWATQQNFNMFVNVYMLTILFFVSVPTNIINMIVFWRHGLRERINLCLFCLASADLMILFVHFEMNLDGLYSAISGSPYQLVVMKYNVNNMIHSLAGFIYISGFLCTLIALERCLCVWSPLKAQTIIQIKTTAIIIALGHVVIMAGHYVIATRWHVVCMFDPLIGQTIDAFYSSDFYLKNEALVDLMDGIVFGIILPGIYVGGILVSTVMTVLKLRTMAQWRDQSTTSTTTGNTTKDVTLTRMLIGTSCLFIVCTTPPLIFHASLPFVPQLSLSGKFYNTYYLFINIQQLLIYVNSSVNFFVYYIFGTKFRRSVQAMFCKSGTCWRRTKNSGVDRVPALSSVESSVSKTTELPR